jgi:DNA-directed RNA polymerase beta subunit
MSDSKLSEWTNELQLRLLKLLWNRRGIHYDERRNYDDYMKYIIDLVEDLGVVEVVDEDDVLIRLRVLKAYYVRPFSDVGLDDPKSAILRDNYTANCYGDIELEYRVKVGRCDVKNQSNSPHSSSSDENGNVDSDGADSDDDGDGDGDDDDDEIVDANDDEDEDVEEDDDYEYEEDEDEDAELDDSKGVSSDGQVYSFGYILNNNDAYTEVVHTAYRSHHFLFEIPVLIGSALCNSRSKLFDPRLQLYPFISIGGMYVVSRNMKVCHNELTSMTNMINFKSSGELEYRGDFVEPGKVGRTNATHIARITEKSIKRPYGFTTMPRVVLEIAREEPPQVAPLMLVAMAYGWSKSHFAQAIRMFFFTARPHLYLHANPRRLFDYFLQCILTDDEDCSTQSDALRRLSDVFKKCRQTSSMSERVSFLSYNLHGEYFPNLNCVRSDGVSCDFDAENVRKGYCLAHMCSELIRTHEMMQDCLHVNDRYRPIDKRSMRRMMFDTPGKLVSRLARKFIRDLVSRGSKTLRDSPDKIDDLDSVLNSNTVKLTKCIGNGSFDNRKVATDSNQNKTFQLTSGLNTEATHKQVQGFTRPALGKNVSSFSSLLPLPDYAGRLDFVTPEGQNCGNMGTKAIGGFISPRMDEACVMRVLVRLMRHYACHFGFISVVDHPYYFENFQFDMEEVSISMVYDTYGGLIGWVSDVQELYRHFRTWRSRGHFSPYVNFEFNPSDNIVHLQSKDGRILRPLIPIEKVDDMMQVLRGDQIMSESKPIRQLISMGLIEYLDPGEEFNSFVVVCDGMDALHESEHYTHLEIHGALMKNICGITPFSNTLAGPRDMYNSNMNKQRISQRFHRVDDGTTTSHSMVYASKRIVSNPLTYTQPMTFETTGVLAVVAMYAHASNMEDPFVVKKAFLERGALATSETSILTATASANYTFMKPNSECRLKKNEEKYKFLNANGTPKLNSLIRGDYAVIGRVHKPKKGGRFRSFPTCDSTFNSDTRCSIVEKVETYPPNAAREEISVVRVYLRHVEIDGNGQIHAHVPENGDKIFFPHAQKGTIVIRDEVDLPFFTDRMGGIPDILINPCAVTRNTPSLFIDAILSTVGALRPDLNQKYANLFLPDNVLEDRLKIAQEIMKDAGFHPEGYRPMALGTDGTPIRCMVFSGLLPVEVLQHKSRKKMRARAHTGPNKELERQPPPGQRKNGGLRASHYFTNCIASYGAGSVFHEIKSTNSDEFVTFWCLRCRIPALACEEYGVYMCQSCRKSDQIGKHVGTYTGMNLFLEETRTMDMGIEPIFENMNLQS